MMKPLPSHARGFSIIEVMLAMTVLMLIFTLLSLTLNQTTLAIFNTRDRSDVEAKATLAFSIFGRDLSQSILRIRGDAPAKAGPGNDSASFYTERSGYTGDRRLSAVTYEIVEGRLMRGSTGQKFGDPSNVAGREILLADQESPLPVPLPGDIQEIVSGAARIEIGYTDPAAEDGPYVVNWPGPGRATAVVVTLVLVEDEARAFMNTAQYEAIEKNFPDATAGTSPHAAWHALTQSSDGSLPPVVHRSLRTYERIFPLQ